MERSLKTGRLILLAALAIALFLSLPRVIIVAYFKANTDAGMNTGNWWNITLKCLYSFLVAYIFLWININREVIGRVRMVDMSRFSHRLAVNLVLLFIIRGLLKQLDLLDAGGFRAEKISLFLFNISLILEVCICVLVAEMYRLLVRNQQERLRNEMLLKANAEATFEVLKNQVNPHFLFNSLNTINAMIDTDTQAAKRFVSNMSHVYRHILSNSGKPVTTLAEEMEFTSAYIDMLMVRHLKSLFVEINIPEEYLAFLLPPVSVQILIENAVKHNVVSLTSPLHVTVVAENGLLAVSNRLNPKKLRSGEAGTGLYNLNQRYIHLCGMGISISDGEGVFNVEIPLLKQLDNDTYATNLSLRP